MKSIYLTIAILLLITSSSIAVTGNASPTTGNYLLGVEYEHPKNLDTFLIGYIQGVIDAKPTYTRCIPDDYTQYQLSQVVKQYIIDHSDKGHWHAPIVVKEAVEEFNTKMCKEKEPTIQYRGNNK